MMKSSNNTTPGAAPLHVGPHPGYLALVFTALFMASLVPVTLLVSTSHFPSPFQPPAEITAYFKSEASKVIFCAFLQFGASIPLGLYAATMVSRLSFHGAKQTGITIALFGGFAASSAIALSALVQWTIAQPGIADDGTLTRALHYLIFAIGGPGYTVPLGLLIAGIAIPAGYMGLLPRWLALAGVGLGIIGELSALSLVIPSALYFVPATRFPGFLWLIAAGFMLSPRARPVAKADVGFQTEIDRIPVHA
jgi:hypothetical protein